MAIATLMTLCRNSDLKQVQIDRELRGFGPRAEFQLLMGVPSRHRICISMYLIHVASTLASKVGSSEELSESNLPKHVLDAMQLNFTGQKFDTTKWASYEACMNQASDGFGLPIRDVTARAWGGFIQYARSNGSKLDPATRQVFPETGFLHPHNEAWP